LRKAPGDQAGRKEGEMATLKEVLESALEIAEYRFVEMSPEEKQSMIDGYKKKKDRPDGYNIETIKDVFDLFKEIRKELDTSSEENIKDSVKDFFKGFF
jgi:hypothetical protein